MDFCGGRKGSAASGMDAEVTEGKWEHASKMPQADSTAGNGKSASPEGFQYSEIKGDLFSCPETESLAHCISADCRMGKGIAVLFKKKFEGVKSLLAQKQNTGGVATLKRGKRFVYYLITKDKYWHKPTYENLQKSLKAMRDHCVEHQVAAVSMPRIGCGLDGLKWSKVSRIIHSVFGTVNIKITVYSL